jgi:TonB family protein
VINNLKLTVLLSLSLTLVTCTTSEAIASQNRFTKDPIEVTLGTPEFRAFHKDVEKRLYKNTTLPATTSDSSPQYKGVIASMVVETDGKIRDVSLSESSGKDAADFACLEAILTASPLPLSSSIKSRQHMQVDFYESRMPYFQIEKGPFNSEQFFASRLDLKEKAVALHLIPVDVLQRYPGLFTVKELDSADNLKALPLEGLIEVGSKYTTQRFLANPKVKGFFADWENFYSTHGTPTKAEIIGFRGELEKKYMGLFLN